MHQVHSIVTKRSRNWTTYFKRRVNLKFKIWEKYKKRRRAERVGTFVQTFKVTVSLGFA